MAIHSNLINFKNHADSERNNIEKEWKTTAIKLGAYIVYGSLFVVLAGVLAIIFLAFKNQAFEPAGFGAFGTMGFGALTLSTGYGMAYFLDRNQIKRFNNSLKDYIKTHQLQNDSTLKEATIQGLADKERFDYSELIAKCKNPNLEYRYGINWNSLVQLKYKTSRGCEFILPCNSSEFNLQSSHTCPINSQYSRFN